MTIEIEVVQGDVFAFQADVLALKFAQGLYGVDRKVVADLLAKGSDIKAQLPSIGSSLLVASRGVVETDAVLFIGVEPLGRFDYETIRNFARSALAELRGRSETRHLTMTLHGGGFGLDEAEAFRAELAGLLDAIHAAEMPSGLRRISIVERNDDTAGRMQQILQAILPQGGVERLALERSSPAPDARADLESVGRDSRSKPLIFVAMPFADEYADRFHYGINGAVNAAGFLCERADLASFTGDVLSWVKERIGNAALVVADLTGANPNVYLEVGYAWGKGVDTVLIVPKGDELKFDVRGQRCLVFNSIRHLEQLLTSELKALSRR